MTEEVFVEIDRVTYRKSSRSNSGGSMCVGVAFKDSAVLVINTKTRGPVIRFTKEEWKAFVEGVKGNEFDIE